MYNENVPNENENVSEGGVINQYPDLSTDPEVLVVLLETINLLQQAFHSAKNRVVATRGTQSVRRRQVYILYHIAHGEGRIERAELASKLNCSVATIDNDIALIKRLVRKECEVRNLPPLAFENFIKAIVKI